MCIFGGSPKIPAPLPPPRQPAPAEQNAADVSPLKIGTSDALDDNTKARFGRNALKIALSAPQSSGLNIPTGV